MIDTILEYVFDVTLMMSCVFLGLGSMLCFIIAIALFGKEGEE